MNPEGIDWNALLENGEKILFLVLGALLTYLTGVATERRADRRAAETASLENELRLFEIGRDHAVAIRDEFKAIYDRLANLPFNDLPGGLKLSRQEIDLMADRAARIPNEVLRNGIGAVSKLLTSPDAFMKHAEFAEFVTPKGPKATPPLVIKQIFAVESLINMLDAYLRQEDPSTQVNPYVEIVIRRGRSMGLSVRNLYED